MGGLDQTRAHKRILVETVIALRPKYGLNILLKYFHLARATFYYHVKKMSKPDKYQSLRNMIHQIFDESHETYGYRRVQMILDTKGIHYAPETIRRIMRQEGLISEVYWRKGQQYRSYHGEVGHVADNLIKQDFKATRPYEKLATDVTQIKVNDQRLYLSAIIDLFSNEVLAYDIRESPNKIQIQQTLSQLTTKITFNDDVILHSDQGWLYQLDNYQNYLKEHQITQSMSRKGNCLDNAPIESFFGLLKKEFVYRLSFKNTTDFIEQLKTHINWFNTKRINRKQGKTPYEIRRFALE